MRPEENCKLEGGEYGILRLALRGSRGHRITVLSLHLRQNGDRDIRGTATDTQSRKMAEILHILGENVENGLAFSHFLVETEKGPGTMSYKKLQFGRTFFTPNPVSVLFLSIADQEILQKRYRVVVSRNFLELRNTARKIRRGKEGKKQSEINGTTEQAHGGSLHADNFIN
jgi:hypothetical protein